MPDSPRESQKPRLAKIRPHGLATAVCGEWDVSIRRACSLLEFDRSTFHYKARRREQASLEARIKEICATRVRYGYQRVHVLLRREGWEVLERTPPPWKLDRKESTRLSLKYRGGKGEIPIVSDTGRGWWDPTSDAKGDVFGLVQWLEPGLSFGHIRKRLREFAGLSPRFPPVDRAGGRNNPDRPVAERWAERKAVWPHSPTWRYLVRKKWLPHAIIEAASRRPAFCGRGRPAAFAHLDGHGVVTHVDVRGPSPTPDAQQAILRRQSGRG